MLFGWLVVLVDNEATEGCGLIQVNALVNLLARFQI